MDPGLSANGSYPNVSVVESCVVNQFSSVRSVFGDSIVVRGDDMDVGSRAVEKVEIELGEREEIVINNRLFKYLMIERSEIVPSGFDNESCQGFWQSDFVERCLKVSGGKLRLKLTPFV